MPFSRWKSLLCSDFYVHRVSRDTFVPHVALLHSLARSLPHLLDLEEPLSFINQPNFCWHYYTHIEFYIAFYSSCLIES